MEMFSRLARALEESEGTLLKLMVYGSVNAVSSANEAMRRVFGEINWPVTWVDGEAFEGGPIAGIQAFAFCGNHVDRIILDGRVVGSVFTDGGARFCLLGGLGPEQATASPAAQTEQTLHQLEAALAQAKFSLGDVARTWFFLDDLLSWYDTFNKVRARLYAKTDFRSGSLPASTGIDGRNPAGTALTVGAWAMQPLNSVLQPGRAEEVASPLQCPAPAYGSSFSRAMEMTSAGVRRLLISGTASIEPGGLTAHRDDVKAQIELTMQVVEAILSSRDMSFADVTRGTAYFKSISDATVLADWCDLRELRKLPVIYTGNGICRADLLFEIELDAIQSDVGPDPGRSLLPS